MLLSFSLKAIMTTQNDNIPEQPPQPVADLSTTEVIHYTLVCGELLFEQDKDKQLRTTKLNTMIRSSHQHVTAHQLGRAQQALQLALFQKLNDPKLKIHNVIIVTLSDMGWMTEEQFQAKPEGVKLQEKVQ